MRVKLRYPIIVLLCVISRSYTAAVKATLLDLHDKSLGVVS